MEKAKISREESKKKIFLFSILILAFATFISIPLCLKEKDAFIVIKSAMKEDIDVYIGTTEENDTKEEKLDNEKAKENSETTVTVSENVDDTAAVVFPLDINSAGVDELLMVKGIGKETAKNIVDYRKINGYFFSMDELLNVYGIGEKKLEMLEEYLYINYPELPETRVPNFIRAEAAENTVNTEMVTTVPYDDIIETTATAENVFETEDFVMETEEFITETDTDFDYEDFFAEKFTGFYDYTEAMFTETEYKPNFPLELNSASARDLTYINGIGEATAQKIVDYARTVGFASVDDLLNVSGIGKSKLEQIRPYVYVDLNYFTGTYSETEYTDSVYTDLETSDSVSSGSEASEIYPVNLNSCTKADLMQLPGIDEQTAENILNLRSEIEYFGKIEELSFVLTDIQLDRILPYIFI